MSKAQRAAARTSASSSSFERPWGVLFMLRFAVRTGDGGGEFRYRLHARNDNREGDPPLVELKAVCEPDDDDGPYLTVILPARVSRGNARRG